MCYRACPDEEGTERTFSTNGESNSGQVTQHVPMKRELKVYHILMIIRKWRCYTACPDEEGTERLGLGLVAFDLVEVTQHVPMKRELKDYK